MIKLIQVIEARIPVGEGTPSDPCRISIQYWSPDGKFLAENDPFKALKDTE